MGVSLVGVLGRDDCVADPSIAGERATIKPAFGVIARRPQADEAISRRMRMRFELASACFARLAMTG